MDDTTTATVQAALGPVALGKAREALATLLAARAEAGGTGDCGEVEDMDQGQSNHDTWWHMSSNITPTPELAGLCTMVEYGDQILTIAVMAILLTAPLG